MKKSTLAAGLNAAAGHTVSAVVSTSTFAPVRPKTSPTTVLIGGHFSPEVRRALLLVQAEPKNAGRNLKQLLGEAINDLCAKYGKPQPYNGEI
jgi:hypothetical protein